VINAIIWVAVVVLSALLAHLHMIYTADRVAATLGYVVALAFVPIVVGAAIGFAGAFMQRDATGRLKSLWRLPVVGMIAAVLPIIWVLWAISQPEH
jgi:flagellar motor component MotA